jgi:hypothetical protein
MAEQRLVLVSPMCVGSTVALPGTRFKVYLYEDNGA